MSKASKILLFAVAFFAIAGSLSPTFAQSPTNLAGFTGLPQLTLTPTLSKNDCVTIFISYSDTCKTTSETPIPKKPQPKPQTSQTNQTTLIVQNQTVQLDSHKIFNSINAYRTSRGLSPFEEDKRVCDLAQTRSNEIPAEIKNGTLHSGLYGRNLPYWIWENAKYGSDEEGTVAWWLASPIHHESIVGDYKYSCVKCTESFCSELFTSFVPK